MSYRRITTLPAVAIVGLSLCVLGQVSPTRFGQASHRSALELRPTATGCALSLDGRAFHQTASTVEQARLIAVPGSTTRLVLWQERNADGGAVPFYAISLDGTRVDTVRATSYVLKLRHGEFDPLRWVPPVEPVLAADELTALYIVQFVVPPLEEFRDALTAAGATVYNFLGNHARIVRMNPAVRARVARLPYVRWIGPYHPAYRLELALLDALTAGTLPETQRYRIQVFERGLKQKQLVAERIAALGGVVEALPAEGFLLEATLTPAQLRAVVRLDEVLFVDRWRQPQAYLNNIRIDGGADHVEVVAGYDGSGVRGEVMDSGLLTTHQAFQHHPPIIHRSNGTSTWHGTAVYGICFSDGTGNADGRGLLPAGQGIFARWSFEDRYGHIAELLGDPYYAVFQTNSWGSCCTTEYGTYSMEIDDIVFDLDIIILQAQANEGTRDSDVSAWAKNNVSVGGIRHYDTLPRSDDAWNQAGSIGPAEDGRVKPDLAYWYDWILTTANNGDYMPDFGGTSGATPTVAGHFGLMFQMWADGVFGNPVDPNGTVFDNRPHAATAKALMVNSAQPYEFSGSNHDLTRVHQGWGLPNLANLYDRRHQMFVINETEVLPNLGSASYTLEVLPDTDALRATLVYTDLPGTTSSTLHRINDLSLRVTSPSAVVYWGNNGLLDGNWSTPGGERNTVDTVENVFVQQPEPGYWTIEVLADELNGDGHVETPEVDADFALVVSGVVPPGEILLPEQYTVVEGRELSGGLNDLFDSDDSRLVLTHSGFFPPWVELEVVTAATTAAPGQLRFRFEGHPTASQVEQRIVMYNYADAQWEEVDVRIMPTADEVITIPIFDEPARFIDPATLEMKTRIRWIGTSFANLFGWEAEIDQTVWHIVP